MIQQYYFRIIFEQAGLNMANSLTAISHTPDIVKVVPARIPRNRCEISMNDNKFGKMSKPDYIYTLG